MSDDRLTDFRRQKDDFFGRHPHSPIPSFRRKDFEGLAYYGPKPELSLRLPVTEANQSEVRVQTSDNQVRTYHRAGRVASR